MDRRSGIQAIIKEFEESEVKGKKGVESQDNFPNLMSFLQVSSLRVQMRSSDVKYTVYVVKKLDQGWYLCKGSGQETTFPEENKKAKIC